MIQPVGWLIATIILLFVEASTFNLVSVWFAVGSAAALISCLFTDSLLAQSVIFVAVSVVCLLALRPLAARLKKPPVPTNADLNIGRIATVLTPVTDEVPGRVRLDGVDWNARALPGTAFQPGERCRVAEIHSTLLMVEPVPVETPIH